LNLVFFIGFLIEVKLENQILTGMKKPAICRRNKAGINKLQILIISIGSAAALAIGFRLENFMCLAYLKGKNGVYLVWVFY
jgi:hypothetical protein